MFQVGAVGAFWCSKVRWEITALAVIIYSNILKYKPAEGKVQGAGVKASKRHKTRQLT